jgi:ankyrin repeat protein
VVRVNAVRTSGRVSTARFFTAARQWDLDLVASALRAHPELAHATDRAGRSALHLTAATEVRRSRRPASSSVAVARALLDAGADVDAVHHVHDGGEVFPAHALWHAVARGGNRPLARFLLRRGADPNWCYWAVVWSDDIATARLLDAHGANVDLTFNGETPLVYATRLRRTRMMRWLLSRGAQVDLADGDGHTPLHHAVRRRHAMPELELLLAHGASLTRAAADGTTPLSVAGPRLAAGLLACAERLARGRAGAAPTA